MTRKDYKLIAKIIREMEMSSNSRRIVARSFSKGLWNHSPLNNLGNRTFNSEKFLQECE